MTYFRKSLTVKFLVLFCFTTSLMYGADDSTVVSRRATQIGDMVIDIAVGFPYYDGEMYKQDIKNQVDNDPSYVITGGQITPHICVKVEKVVTNQLSLGIEYTYADYYTNFKDGLNTNFSEKSNKQRFLCKINYHVDLQTMFNVENSESLDPYITLGFGYRMNRYSNSETGKSIADYDNFTQSLPIALRGAAGLRYFITSSMAFNAEIGIGGPLVLFGLSYKI